MHLFVCTLCVRYPSHLILSEFVAQIFGGVQILGKVHTLGIPENQNIKKFIYFNT